MNEFYKGVILSILRKSLTGVSAWAITNGWLTGDQTTEITLGIAGLVASLLLSVWDQYGKQVTTLAALQLPKGATMNDAKALAKTDSAPAVTTPSNVAPPPATSGDIVKATGAGLPSLFLALALLPGLAFAPACRAGKVVATPPEAAEAGADLSAIVAKATNVMLTAYKAGQVPAAAADPFMAAIDTKVLPLSRRAKTAVAVWKAALDGPAKVQSGEDLKRILAELEREAQGVFGMALPPAVSASIGNIASDLYDAIGKIRALIAAARASASEPALVAVEN